MNMGKTIAMSAVGGMVAGIAGCGGAPAVPSGMPDPAAAAAAAAPPGAMSAAAAAGVPGAKECCKGKNDCKGKGNCKTDKNECKGKNDCKGKGGCKAADCK
jgi:hypothetical protein